jgi:hypothetical protein
MKVFAPPGTCFLEVEDKTAEYADDESTQAITCVVSDETGKNLGAC